MIQDQIGKEQCRWFIEKGFDKYFQFQKFKSLKVFEVKCKLCTPVKSLSVSVTSAYNLKIHLKVNSFINVSSTERLAHLFCVHKLFQKTHASTYEQLFNVNGKENTGEPANKNNTANEVYDFIGNHARAINQVCNKCLEFTTSLSM